MQFCGLRLYQQLLRLGTRCFALFFMLSLSLSNISSADSKASPSPFVLDLSDPSKSEFTFNVPAEGTVPLTLFRSTQETLPATLELRLGLPFRDPNGETVTVTFAKREQTGKATAEKQKETSPEKTDAGESFSVPTNRAVVPIALHVSELPTDEAFTGWLLLIGKKAMDSTKISGPSQPQTNDQTKEAILGQWKISLKQASMPSPATLVLQKQPRELTITKPTWGWANKSEDNWEDAVREGRTIVLHVAEKSGRWPLECISIGLEEITKVPGGARFDLERNVSVWSNDGQKDVPLKTCLTVLKKDKEAASGSLKLAFRYLEAGEYIITLRVRAANSKTDDGQKFQLTIKVRHSVWWAVLTLIGAAVVSFVGTMLFSLYKKRYELTDRISNLRPSWFAGWKQSHLYLAVITVDALLHQALELTRSVWRGTPDIITKRIDRAEGILKILSRIQELEAKFEARGLPKPVQERAERQLTKITIQLGESQLSPEREKLLDDQLKSLESWLTDPRYVGYWQNLFDVANRLLVEVDGSKITDQQMKDELTTLATSMVGILRAVVEQLQKQAGGNDVSKEMVRLEDDLTRLRIFWDRRNREDLFTALVARKNEPLEVFTKAADDQLWSQLQALQHQGKVSVDVSPKPGLDPLEAYQPLTFTVDPGDEFISQSNLFRKLIEYHWEIKLQRNEEGIKRFLKRWKHSKTPPAKPPLAPISKTPTILQYAPWACDLKVKVTLKRKGAIPIPIEYPQAISIEKSKELTRLKAFLTMELATTAVAGAIALVSGLQTYYFSVITFGSFNDYLSLFLWAAAIDQSKNFAETIQSVKKST